MVEPSAGMDGPWWVVFEHPEGDKFYSSHEHKEHAEELAAQKNADIAAEEYKGPKWPYKVVPKTGLL